MYFVNKPINFWNKLLMSKVMNVCFPAIFCVSAGILLTACSSSIPVYQNLSTDAVVVKAKKNSPQLAQTLTVDIGDNLLMKVSGSYLENKSQSVTLLTDIDANNDEYPSLKKGKTTVLGMSSAGGNAACFAEAKYRDGVVKFCLFDEEKDGYFEMGSFTGDETYSLNIPYNIFSDNSKSPEKGYLRKTLSYKGLSNGKINFNYSEYAGNMVRATLSQDFSIINQQDAHVLLNFKGAEIKIKKADLLHVTYEVVQHFR